MSADAVDSERADSPPGEGAPAGDRCPQCGAGLAPDQEWCLECGASRTLIYPPPDWRVPVAVVVLVILLALAGFAFALDRVSAGSSSGGGIPATAVGPRSATSQVPTPPPPTADASANGGRAANSTGAVVHGIASWPIGLSGWTVVLESFGTEADAYSRARHIVSLYKLPVGVLDTSEHPAMAPGSWLVFSGRYVQRARAEAAARRLLAREYTGARVELVAPRGGL